MLQKLFQNFFITRTAGASGKTLKKNRKSPSQHRKKHVKDLQRIFALPAVQCKW